MYLAAAELASLGLARSRDSEPGCASRAHPLGQNCASRAARHSAVEPEFRTGRFELLVRRALNVNCPPRTTVPVVRCQSVAASLEWLAVSIRSSHCSLDCSVCLPAS